MRFWFIIIILYILLRTVQKAVQDYRYTKSIRTELDRRFFGYLTCERSDAPELVGFRQVIRRETLIGRSPRCDLCIPSRCVDLSHALILARDKQLILCDMSAGSGVRLNGERIPKEAVLCHDDVIGVGETDIRVSLEG